MYCASMVIIAVAILILIHFMYQAIFPLKTVEINHTDIRTPIVRAGSTLEFELDWCTYGQYPVTVHRRMVDGFVFTLPETETTTPPRGCYESIIRSVEIPDVTPSGTYYIQIELVIQVNGLRDEIVSFETDTFEVIGK